jgi:hypothetical protein
MSKSGDKKRKITTDAEEETSNKKRKISIETLEPEWTSVGVVNIHVKNLLFVFDDKAGKSRSFGADAL